MDDWPGAGHTAHTPLGKSSRLAINPEFQGEGYGYTLLRDLLLYYGRKGARTVTVNTQKDNQPSMCLYKKAGFSPTGEEYPFFKYSIQNFTNSVQHGKITRPKIKVEEYGTKR